MLFPQIEHYVDLAAIDAFLGKRDRGEHLVVAILANTYYTLDYCSKKNGKGLRCCTTLLFLWLTVHLFHSSKRMRCPIKDHYWSCVKFLTKAEWTARLDEAIERFIRWHPQWNKREDVIIRCGGFPNIPLMGTQGAINCNPKLTLCQARYPMVLPSVRGGDSTLHPPRSRDTGGRVLEENPPSLEKDHQGRTQVGTVEMQSFVQLQVLAAAQSREKGLRELEWNQASLEKEELIVALADTRSKEDDARGHLRRLQE
ncbi:hypothetical protein CR513_15792, partial [Mucuna pruriens]